MSKTRTTGRSVLSVVWVLAAGLIGQAASAATFGVPTVAEIYSAGNASGSFGGTAPVVLGVTGGQALNIAATGSVNFDIYVANNYIFSPDGNNAFYHDSVIPNSLGNGISGYRGPTAALVGVFVADNNPASAPATLDFNAAGATDFASISPLLGQIFFIGDGSSSGVAQSFIAPAGATKLYFGYADALECGAIRIDQSNFQGSSPNYYNDNDTVGLQVTTSVPEPVGVLGLVVAGLGMARSRRR